MSVTFTMTSSNGELELEPAIFCYQRISSGGIGTPTKPQNLQPTTLLAKMCWDNRGTKLVSLANPCVKSFEAHDTKRSHV